jgi:hypothetical protein
VVDHSFLKMPMNLTLTCKRKHIQSK